MNFPTRPFGYDRLPQGEAGLVADSPRFLLYSHDGLGLGHMRRNLAIGEALVSIAPNAAVLLVTGASHSARFSLPSNVDSLKLPELKKVHNQEYASRKLGISYEEIVALRSSLIEAAIHSFRPDVLLADKHPLGVSGELLAGLAQLRANGGRAVLGLRDILDDRETVMEEWFGLGLYDQVLELYDQILVYGQPEVFDPVAQYSFPRRLAARTRFCGYVVNQSKPGLITDTGLTRLLGERRTGPLVLATVGGGEDGFAILKTFIRASETAQWTGVIVAGPMMPADELEVLHRLCAEAGIFFEPFVSRLEAFIGNFDALVCMGGYNTVVEAAAAGIPTICVPRSAPRQEQQLRASAFNELKLLKLIPLPELTPSLLKNTIDAQLGISRPELMERVRNTLSFEGAFNAASALLALSITAQSETIRHPEAVVA